jgi:hypothetical protein
MTDMRAHQSWSATGSERQRTGELGLQNRRLQVRFLSHLPLETLNSSGSQGITEQAASSCTHERLPPILPVPQ